MSVFICYAQQSENTAQNSAIYYEPDTYLYDKYLKDPSEAVYNEEQNRDIYNNYGSSESMEYLNRGDADYYNGGSDFDRNY